MTPRTTIVWRTSRHLAFACWLHVMAGAFVVGCVATIWIAAAALSPLFAGTFVPGLVSLFGKPIAIVLIALASIELGCAAALLRGRRWPRFGIGAISALLLFVFPIGTMLGAYTLFALSQPIDRRGIVLDAASSGFDRDPASGPYASRDG